MPVDAETKSETKSKSLPPVDSDGESKRAATALQRCRSALKKASLTNDWSRWVAQSLLAGLPAETE